MSIIFQHDVLLFTNSMRFNLPDCWLLDCRCFRRIIRSDQTALQSKKCLYFWKQSILHLCDVSPFYFHQANVSVERGDEADEAKGISRISATSYWNRRQKNKLEKPSDFLILYHVIHMWLNLKMYVSYIL